MGYPSKYQSLCIVQYIKSNQKPQKQMHKHNYSKSKCMTNQYFKNQQEVPASSSPHLRSNYFILSLSLPLYKLQGVQSTPRIFTFVYLVPGL